jgi:response regulator RpfG family c-di-GMP phosphodiesterase
MIIPAAPELRATLAGALERTGAEDLLAELGAVSPSDREHGERVGQTAMGLTMNMYGQGAMALTAGFAGTLHDVGKVDAEVQSMISPAGRLTPEEKDRVNRIHTTLGASMILHLESQEQDADLIEEAATAALYHHLSPRELADRPETTVVTRLVQIADYFDAMQDTGRAYHYGKAMSQREAIESIRYKLNRDGAMDNVARLAMAHMDAHEMQVLTAAA